MDAEGLVTDAFAQLDLTVQFLHETSDRGIDVNLEPSGIHVEIQVKRRAPLTDDDAAYPVLRAQHLPPNAPPLVIADRVTATAGERLLQSRRVGFLDLRGRCVSWLAN